MKKLFSSLMIVAMTAMTFTACQDVPAPYEIPGTGDNEVKKEELGTVEKPLTVSEALALINSYKDGGVSSAEAVVKGKVVSVGYLDTENKTLSFYISEDGTATSQIQCYSCKGVNGAGIESKDYLKVGSVVVVKGILKKFVNKSGVTNPELDAGCEIISITEGEPQESKSTLESPFTVSQAIAAGSGLEYVKGFIVGSVEGQKLAEGAHFSTENAVATNIILAESASETDVTKVMAVQLPSGTDIRTKLNIKDNAGNLGKEVVLYGSIENYFNQLGLKSVTFAVLDGVEIGTKPGSDPAPSGDVQTVTVSQFNDAAESTSVWYQLTGTISNLKAGDKYGNFDLTDATGSVYVYGVLSTKGGAKQKFQELVTAHNIQNGTTITIIGNRGSFNGKIEVVNAYFVSAQN